MSGTGLTAPGAGTPGRPGSRRGGFTVRRRWGMAAVAIAAVSAGSLAFWLSGGPGGVLAAGGPQTTTARNGEVWLHGKITQDGCDQSEAHVAIGDVGCSITVNGYDVSVIPGNIRLPHSPGTLTGLDASADQAGQRADVYAQLTGPHSATILSAPKYHARISG